MERLKSYSFLDWGPHESEETPLKYYLRFSSLTVRTTCLLGSTRSSFDTKGTIFDITGVSLNTVPIPFNENLITLGDEG